MGGSNSTVRNVNNQTVINKSQIDILNENITNQIANSQISQAASCGASTSQDQSIKFEDITSAPGYPISIQDIRQGQYAFLDFTCQQTQQTRTDIANSLLNDMGNNLQDHNSTTIMAELEAQAAANVKNGFAGWGGGGSHSDSDNQINWDVTTGITQELRNVIENTIENNFTANNLAECTTALKQSQSAVFSGIHSGGSVIIGGISQDQMLDAYARCIQDQKVAQEMTNVITNATSVKIEDDTGSGTRSKEAGTATSETINNGPFESLGEMFSSILSGIGAILSNFRASSILSVILIALVLCCLIIAVAGWFIMSGFTPQQAAQTAELAALGGGSYMTETSSLGMTAATNSYSEFGLIY